ncbi:PIN domain-like protein [Mycena filopes]|nr:PIN domain-like protein [Mycena filopes]
MEILTPAAETRSLLNLATIEGFETNNRGLRTFIVGLDISIRMNAIVARLQAAGVFNPGLPGEKLVLQKLFYQLCQLSLAPLTIVFVFDGPGRPPIKRGTRVLYRPSWLDQQLKVMISAFGFYFYEATQAPGEAEAELAQLNKNGHIDAIITENSDAFLFGARCVIRTRVFTSRSIKDSVSMDEGGLLLGALLLGGDYGPGLTGASITVAQALAAEGFGGDLIDILRACVGVERRQRLAVWRNGLREELRTNSSGRLGKRQRKLADSISDKFPDIEIAQLYLTPLTSESAGYTGPMPNGQLWHPVEPSIIELSALCSTHFGWHGHELLARFNSKLWPAVAFRMVSSVRNYHPFAQCSEGNHQAFVFYNSASNLFVSRRSKAHMLKRFKANNCRQAFADSADLELYQVRMSTKTFVQLAALDALPETAEAEIELTSIPKSVLAVAMRDTSLPFTDASLNFLILLRTLPSLSCLLFPWSARVRTRLTLIQMPMRREWLS